MTEPGRTCPVAYHYGARALANTTPLEADCLYIIGGLYGNLFALDAIEALASGEKTRPRLIFNGDFHWFDAEPEWYGEIARRVAGHTAIRGNVETELAAPSAKAGCGCAYPEFVDSEVVTRSNRILSHLKKAAQQSAAPPESLAHLPMFLTARVGGQRVGIVHGDAVSLAGWGFAAETVHVGAQRTLIQNWFELAEVSVFASTHTCLPVLEQFDLSAKRQGWLVNNGSSGMPNFSATQFGLITRIATAPPRVGTALYGCRIADTYIDALPIHFDQQAWTDRFLSVWPPGSDAHSSYYDRIVRGPDFPLRRILHTAAR